MMMNWWHKFRTAVGRQALPPDEIDLMVHLAQGWTLKSHRFLDGRKMYKLYAPDGQSCQLTYALVQNLLRRKLITTNQKFPAATFLLTNKGQAIAAQHNARTNGLAALVDFET